MLYRESGTRTRALREQEDNAARRATHEAARDLQSIPAMRFKAETNLSLEFPPLPKTMISVSKLLEDSGFMPDPHELAHTIKGDPVITAAVVGRANSAYYGMQHRIDEVRKAVLLIGFMEVTHIVLAAGFFRLTGPLSTPEQHLIFDKILERSIGGARYAERIAAYLELKAGERARVFTLVLLHAVGRMILLYNRPADYEGLWHINEGRAPSAQQERAIFGIDHAEIGAMAIEQWGLPALTSRVVAHHLRPEALIEGQPVGGEGTGSGASGSEAYRLALIASLSVSAFEMLVAAKSHPENLEVLSGGEAERPVVGGGEKSAFGGAKPDGEEETVPRGEDLFFRRAASLCGVVSSRQVSPEALLLFIEEQREATAAYVRMMTAAPSPES